MPGSVRAHLKSNDKEAIIDSEKRESIVIAAPSPIMLGTLQIKPKA